VENVSSNSPLIKALGRHTASFLWNLGKSLFCRSFGIVWTLYAATFTVANTVETVCKDYHLNTVSSAVFLSTFVVNVPLGVYKDIRFAQLFGALTGTPGEATTTAVRQMGIGIPPTTIPATVKTRSHVKLRVSRAATSVFLIRDAITLYGSFVLPPFVAKALPPDTFTNPHTEMTVSQLTVPVLTQLFATPLHLIGLDYHNRQRSLPLSDRFAQVRGSLLPSTVVRCIRIVPAFSIGCWTNTELRTLFHGRSWFERGRTTGKKGGLVLGS